MPLDPSASSTLNSPADAQVIAALRRFLPDFYFVNAPLSRMRRHLALLEAASWSESGVQMEFYRGPGASFTELTLLTGDRDTPGLLSSVAATLMASGVSVHTAWIHTLEAPGEPKTRLALDTFLLGESAFLRPRTLSPKTQTLLREALTRALNDKTSAEEVLGHASLVRQKAARKPVRVSDASAARAGEWSLFKLRAFDSSGVFYRITRALARAGAHIEHAQINTFEKEADDVFFVLDAHTGAPFEDDEAQGVLLRVCDELERSE